MHKVAKFGGTSLASRKEFEKVIEVIKADSQRRYVVVSAPGKTNSGKKITDLLIDVFKGNTEALNEVKGRLEEIIPESPDLLKELYQELDIRVQEKKEDPIKAWGEYASARAMTEIMRRKGLEANFYDPKEIGFQALIKNRSVHPDPSCYSKIGEKLKTAKGICVIPGFYLFTKSGELVTFSRNGSDISGAVIANAVDASEYENFTDELGLRRADPRIVPDSELIPEITYREARELAYMGFKLQEESLHPLMEKRIPLHVRSTFNPNQQGTLIVSDRIVPKEEVIVGVTAKRNYVMINLFKMFMNQEVGFGEKVFSVLREMDIPYEHSPTGVDSMSLIIHNDYVISPGKLNRLVRKINQRAGPLEIDLDTNNVISIVSVAGLGMQYHSNTDLRVISALDRQGIARRFLDEGAKDLSLFLGVDNFQADNAVRAIYQEFYGKNLSS